MRIISQGGIGTIDLPYEQVGIGINAHNNKEIIAYPIISLNEDDYWTMAKYSTEAKTKKAMEMLREAYTGRFITNADISDDFNEQLKELMKGGFGTVIVKETNDSKIEFNNLNGYFQFPSDEELED